MNLGHFYPSIYWKTACVSVDAGAINEEDFYTNFHATNRVSCRIISDLKFDERCKRNIEVRNEWRKIKCKDKN